MTLFTPEVLNYLGALPTHYAVSASDTITIWTNTFLHVYNDSAVTDVITYDAADGGYLVTISLLAGEEVVMNIDRAVYGSPITVTHSHPGDVYLAALNYDVQSPVDDLSDVTFEFLVKFDSYDASGDVILFSKKQDETSSFIVGVLSGGTVSLSRKTTDDNVDIWSSNAGLISLDTVYDIKISWISGTGPSPSGTPIPPLLTISDDDHTMSRSATGTGDWLSDVGNPIILGAWSNDTGYAFLGTWYLFRLHNAILTREEKRENYLHEKWRYEGMEEPSIETISPNVSVDFDHAWAYAPHVEAGEIAVLAPSFEELSTVVTLGTLECGGTETLFVITPTDITITSTTITNAMETFAPIVAIGYPEITPYDVVITDSLSLNTILTESLSLNPTLTDSVEFDVILAEEP